MTADLRARVWEFLPARRCKARVTTPHVIAANLDAPLTDVLHVMADLDRDGCIVRDKSGWHRGFPPAQGQP